MRDPYPPPKSRPRLHSEFRNPVPTPRISWRIGLDLFSLLTFHWLFLLLARFHFASYVGLYRRLAAPHFYTESSVRSPAKNHLPFSAAPANGDAAGRCPLIIFCLISTRLCFRLTFAFVIVVAFFFLLLVFPNNVRVSGANLLLLHSLDLIPVYQ